MLGLSIVLGWIIPGIAHLIAGFVGGRYAGSVGNAVIAALIPALAVAALTLFASAVLVGPVAGGMVGMGVGILSAASSIGMVIMAMIGAATAKS